MRGHGTTARCQSRDLQEPDAAHPGLLARAVEGNHLDLVEELLRRGAEVEERDDDGRTPLLLAAEGGFPRIVAVLLRAGADRCATDHDGRTARDLAGGIRDYPVRLLLKPPGSGPRSD